MNYFRDFLNVRTRLRRLRATRLTFARCIPHLLTGISSDDSEYSRRRFPRAIVEDLGAEYHRNNDDKPDQEKRTWIERKMDEGKEVRKVCGGFTTDSDLITVRVGVLITSPPPAREALRELGEAAGGEGGEDARGKAGGVSSFPRQACGAVGR